MKKQNKAFTLVELMIVIAIIGVLAATLLPRLQGAQERSRDSGRVTSLKSTAAVMEVFYQDNGQYPENPASDTTPAPTAELYCLSTDNAGTVSTEMTNLFKGGISPTDPTGSNPNSACTVVGAYGYRLLDSRSGTPGSGYALWANLEAYRTANFDNGGGEIQAATSVSDIDLVESGITIESTVDTKHTIYVERN